MAYDAAHAPDNDGTDDDPVRELLMTCDRSPLEGLGWIDRLDDELKSRPMIMFARFIALRHLAIDGLFGGGTAELGGTSADRIARIMDAENRANADRALAQVAAIEARHPGYIDDLGGPEDRFGQRMVDDICIVNERLQPGKVQQVLGWTKLSYFGGERIGNLPNVFDAADDALIRAAIRTKVRPSQIARSAVSYAKGEDGRRRRYLDAFLMEKDFRTTANFGEANMFCSARIFDDGDVELSGMEPDAAPTPRGAPNRPAEPEGGGLLGKAGRRLGRWLAGA